MFLCSLLPVSMHRDKHIHHTHAHLQLHKTDVTVVMLCTTTPCCSKIETNACESWPCVKLLHDHWSGSFDWIPVWLSLTWSICATVLGLGLGSGVEVGGVWSYHTERLLGSLQPSASIFPLFWWEPNVVLESLCLSVFVPVSHHPVQGYASTAVSGSV